MPILPLPLLRSTGLAPAPAPDSSVDSLCRSHAAQITRWAERMGGPGIDPDDTVQEVLLIAARRLPEFRGDAKLSTWLFRITTRIVANQRRGARRRLTWLRLTRRIEDQTASDAPGPADDLERVEATRRFYQVLEELPEHHRQVLVLFELEELSTEDIARLLERPPATVRVWLHRARVRFIGAWRRAQKESGE